MTQLQVNDLCRADDDMPSGKFEEIAGVNCYVATPTQDYPKDKVLLYLTDVFGVQLVNHQARIASLALLGGPSLTLHRCQSDLSR